MLTRTRREWDAIGQRLASEGIGALALDLRGHGESGASPAMDPERIDYSAMVLDLRAARRYLAQRSDVQQSRVGIAGASIGANLAALEASSDPRSPAWRCCRPRWTIAACASSRGAQGHAADAAGRRRRRPYASRSARDLQKAGGGPRELLILKQAGHGTAMLARDPSLPARWWTGFAERCYDLLSVPKESVVFGIAGVFFGILVGWMIGSQQARPPQRPPRPAAAPSGADRRRSTSRAPRARGDDREGTQRRRVAVQLGDLYFDADASPRRPVVRRRAADQSRST
jgi:dienelactone hydrolase